MTCPVAYSSFKCHTHTRTHTGLKVLHVNIIINSANVTVQMIKASQSHFSSPVTCKEEMMSVVTCEISPARFYSCAEFQAL